MSPCLREREAVYRIDLRLARSTRVEMAFYVVEFVNARVEREEEEKDR